MLGFPLFESRGRAPLGRGGGEAGYWPRPVEADEILAEISSRIVARAPGRPSTTSFLSASSRSRGCEPGRACDHSAGAAAPTIGPTVSLPAGSPRS